MMFVGVALVHDSQTNNCVSVVPLDNAVHVFFKAHWIFAVITVVGWFHSVVGFCTDIWFYDMNSTINKHYFPNQIFLLLKAGPVYLFLQCFRLCIKMVKLCSYDIAQCSVLRTTQSALPFIPEEPFHPKLSPLTHFPTTHSATLQLLCKSRSLKQFHHFLLFLSVIGIVF